MDKFGRDRSQFHLMRAQAHLANDDASRALRHLHKCKFGSRSMYKPPAGLDRPPPPAPQDWSSINNAAHWKEIENAGGRTAENERQKKAFDDKTRFFGGSADTAKFGALPTGSAPRVALSEAEKAEKTDKEKKKAELHAKIAGFKDRTKVPTKT
jgi:hypothetical protein